jgi:hypothetical protein
MRARHHPVQLWGLDRGRSGGLDWQVRPVSPASPPPYCISAHVRHNSKPSPHIGSCTRGCLGGSWRASGPEDRPIS